MKGDLLAYIVESSGAGQDVAALRAALARAEANHEVAVAQRERLAGLLEQCAISRKRLEQAIAAEKIAEAELEAAQNRLDARGGAVEAAAGIVVCAPVSGMIASISAGAGQYIQPGDPLIHIVRTDRLRLTAAVSEADSLKLQSPHGVWFKAGSLPSPVIIDGMNGELVAVGRAVDQRMRTIPVILEFDNPDNVLPVGMHVMAWVYTGQSRRSVAVPAEALVDDQGQSILYVMAGGESFERRIVRTGIRDGNFVEITAGLEPGEHVVTEGGYLVRLAAAGPAKTGHGHAH
jgi:RND family efflux transporter MFP subunit